MGNAFGALNAVGAAAQALGAGLSPPAAIATAANLAVSRSAAAGGNLSLATATQYATIGANTQLAHGDVAAQASNIATHEYALTVRLLHRVSRRHQAHRPVVQHAAAVGRHRAAG